MYSGAKSRLSLTNLHLRPRQLSTGEKSLPINRISSVDQGTKFTTDYKKYATTSNGKIVSYFHDISLGLDSESFEVNMVVEIPRWSNGKFEINTRLEGNPITQDVKKGKVRFVKNLFPFHGYIHNYGALPQTWEDPTAKSEELNLRGDNDPLDVCEIGSSIYETGEVKRVKILGSLALIDDGELDWKVIVIQIDDPLAPHLNDIHDVYEKCPGLLDATRRWFKDYKIPDGKPENSFAFDGNYKNKHETLKVILNCHKSWLKLINSNSSDLPTTANTTLPGSPGFLNAFDVNNLIVDPFKGYAAKPDDIDNIYFVN